MFGDKPCGPFPDYASLSAVYNRKRDRTKGTTYLDGRSNTIRSDTEPFDDSRPLVFTHIVTSTCAASLSGGMEGSGWWLGARFVGVLPTVVREYVSMVYAANVPDSWNHTESFSSFAFFLTAAPETLVHTLPQTHVC
jgi:hypothetical protein